MLTIRYESTFRKDFKRVLKRGYDIRLLENVIDVLANERTLPENTKITGLSVSILTTANVI